MPPEKQSGKRSVEKYVRVTLLIGDGTSGPDNTYTYNDHIYGRFEKSGLFEKIGAGSSGWPYTIFVNFNVVNNNDDSVSTAAYLASAATLFIVPTKADFTYTMKVTVTAGDAVKVYRYADRKEYMSSILDADDHITYGAIDNLLSRFFGELRRDKILPKVSSVNFENSDTKMESTKEERIYF
jgi:hypothetical protein